MKHVTNEEFEAALSNKDNIQIIKYVCNQFSRQLPQDVLKVCGQRALWKCLRWHEPQKRKFTSSLYQTVKFECFQELNQIKIKKYKNKTTFSLDSHQTIYNLHHHDDIKKDIQKNIQDSTNCIQNKENALEIDDLLRILPKKHADILKDRYIMEMKLKEIAKKYSCSRQLISKIISDSISLIKQQFGVSYS